MCSTKCLFIDYVQVCSKDERFILDRGTKKSEKLRNSLLRGAAIPTDILPNRLANQDAAFEKAIEHKNKLLEYDRSRYV